MKEVIAFDIETGPLPDADLIASMPEFSAPRNLKDPAKIQAAIEEKRSDYVERAALDATTGQVLAIGVGNAGKWTEIIYGPEHEVLSRWWKYADTVVNSDGILCGWCIAHFDLPFLIRRSWIVGAFVPEWIQRGRYFDRSFVDLADLWSCGRREDVRSLDSVARALGVGSKNGHGADFARLFNGTAEDRQQAVAYLENDIKLTVAVAERLGVGKGAT